MKKKLFFLTVQAAVAVMVCSCGDKSKKETEQPINLDTTVGELVKFGPIAPVPVHGYGIVSGLYGSGSSECPAQLRSELEKYVWKQMPKASPFEIKQFIESTDTAVVEIVGLMPPLITTGDTFDVMVKPFSQTQTVSLHGGQLLMAELKETSRMKTFDQYAKTVGGAVGQIFSAKNAAGQTSYYLLGGGIGSLDIPISVLLINPNFQAASAIRNRINERFGQNTANATSKGEIQLVIPRSYRTKKERFLSMIRLMYLSVDESLRSKHIASLCEQLSNPQKAEEAEIALEAIGRPSLAALKKLLLSDINESIQFHAARCIVNIGDTYGIDALKTIARTPQSPLRKLAVEAITNVRLKDVEPFLAELLLEEDIEIRLAAYSKLRELKSIYIKRYAIGSDFFVDLVNSPCEKTIYAFRKDSPGIILFGAPLMCKKDLFVDMDQVMINTLGDGKISLSRRHPNRPKLIGPIKSSYSVEDLVRTLGYPPEIEAFKNPWPGLGICYSEILAILEKMCHDNLIEATYVAGPLTDAGAFFEKKAEKTDKDKAPAAETPNKANNPK